MAQFTSYLIVYLIGYYFIHKNIIKDDSMKATSVLLTLIIFVAFRIIADISGNDYYTILDMITTIVDSFIYAVVAFLYVRKKTLYEIMHLGKKEPKS